MTSLFLSIFTQLSFFALSGLVLSSAFSNPNSILYSFSDGNWKGDACTIGGLDSGELGDEACLVVSGNGEMGYPNSLEINVDLPRDLSHLPVVVFDIGVRSNSMQTTKGTLSWDGVLVAVIDASGSSEELKVIHQDISPGTLNLLQGPHTIRISAEDTSNQWDYLEIDALRAGPPFEPPCGGGHLLPFEILPLGNANWRGDGGTWGGLDRDTDLASDKAAVIVQAGSIEFPSTFNLPVNLSMDFSAHPVKVTIGYRRNHRMSHQGQLLWDTKPLAVCTPYMDQQELNGRDSILAEQFVLCNKGEFNFTPGEHILSFSVSATETPKSMFQVDSLLLEASSELVPTSSIYLDEWSLYACPTMGDIERAALDHFLKAAQSLGAADFKVLDSTPESSKPSFIIGTANNDSNILNLFHSIPEFSSLFKDLKPFQRNECYLISQPDSKRIYACGNEPLGTVYAISDLELRLRQKEGRVYLEFPSTSGAHKGFMIFEKPAIEVRGEYMNIGYNHMGITPHEWDQERWHTYIDLLVMARLNHFYFYIWNDVYNLYHGSIHSKEPLNQTLHENVRDMIQYAHKRGLQVTYMMCPTYFPNDVWSAHPEIHAEIEYVDHGFPAVCPQAPGAWDMMKDIALNEMRWFSEADALQIWFYDPGGCWCTKNGCKDHQAEILARQVKEFYDLFRTLNPNAAIEYNYWPAWLWEDRLGIKYREDLCGRIRDLLGPEYIQATAVGSSDNNVTLPIQETKQGFLGTAFIFGANPESGYDFLIPHLTYMRETAQRIRDSGVNGAFGHRLEAWTRYPATFFMGQYLWNPDQHAENIVQLYSNWQTANRSTGILLAEAILFLDQFTYEGANALIGGRMQRLTDIAFSCIPESHRELIEYFPAMMGALAVIGRSEGIEDNASLSTLADEFGTVLRKSHTFVPLSNDQNYLFTKYRSYLLKGWKNSAF